MLDPESILQLYTTVLDKIARKNGIGRIRIQGKISPVTRFYVRGNLRFEDKVCKVLNFNKLSSQCAYLHKYAPLHTYIVFHEMEYILEQERDLFRELLKSGIFKMCCLGGGPGVDAVGVLEALSGAFGAFKSSVTIIDIVKKWETAFAAILDELSRGTNASAWKYFGRSIHYIGADLLSAMTDEVAKSIASACFITMVKFISGAICKDTESMVEEIFRVMKPGAFVLFIDNDAGGFYEIIRRSADKHSFKTVYGPRRHISYSVKGLKQNKFGRTSCFETIVTIILLQKPLIFNLQKSYSIKDNFQNASALSNYEPTSRTNDRDKTIQLKKFRSACNQDIRNMPLSTCNKPTLHANEDDIGNYQLENSCSTYNQYASRVPITSRNQTISYTDSNYMTAQIQNICYTYKENTRNAPFGTFNQYILHINNNDNREYQPQILYNQPSLPINGDLNCDASKSTAAFSSWSFKNYFLYCYRLGANIYRLLIRYRGKWILLFCVGFLLIIKRGNRITLPEMLPKKGFWRENLQKIIFKHQFSKIQGFVPPSRTILSSYIHYLNYEMPADGVSGSVG